MKMIINLTQHEATQTQALAGLVDLSPEGREKLSYYLTVPEEELQASEDVFKNVLHARVAGIVSLIWPLLVEEDEARAKEAVRFYSEGDSFEGWNASRRYLCDALIGGAPYLVDLLKERLKELGVRPVYATSVRRSVEEIMPDGSVRKTQVFEHLRFRGA